jgi:hypothetical protein
MVSFREPFGMNCSKSLPAWKKDAKTPSLFQRVSHEDTLFDG